MFFKSDADIKYIFDGLVSRSLPKSEWTHAAHFAAAIAILPDDNYDAIRDMPGLIRAYNEVTGVPNTDTDGYHHTITLASLMAAQDVLDRAPSRQPLYEITNDLLASDYGHSTWLLAYWTKDCLFSVKARKTWVEPDIQGLPFKYRHEK